MKNNIFNIPYSGRVSTCLVVVCVLSIMFLWAFPSYAQIDNASFYTGGDCGSLTAGGGVSFYEPNCEPTGIFSEFICEYESIVSSVLSETYCTMVNAMRVPLQAMLTMFVAFWGIMLLTGQTPFTARDGAIMLLKFALVFTVATEAEFALGIIYNGLMGFLQEGVLIILAAIGGYEFSGGGSVLAQMDETVGEIVEQFAEANDSAPGAGGDEDCSNAVLAMSLMFLASAPAVTMLAFMMIYKLLMVAIKTIFAYLLALTGIMFLITLTPVFASFALFKTTSGMFDMWVKYLISFALQIVIVFAFIGFVIELGVIEDFEELLDLAAPYENTKAQTGYRFGMQVCTICEGLTTGDDGSLTCPEGARGSDPLEPMALIDVLAMLGGRFAYLLIMAYILDGILKRAPEIAVTISQARFAPQLGSSLENRFAGIGNGITNGVRNVLGN